MRDEDIMVSKSVLADLLFKSINIMETAANTTTDTDTVQKLTVGYHEILDEIKANKIGAKDEKQKE